jgi:hypothetical protein
MKWWQHPGSATLEFWMQIISIGLRNCIRWCDFGLFFLSEIALNLKGWQKVIFFSQKKWIDLRMKRNVFVTCNMSWYYAVLRNRNFFYGSGPDFWQVPVLAPVPAPVPAVLRPWNDEIGKHSFQRKFLKKSCVLVFYRKLFYLEKF